MMMRNGESKTAAALGLCAAILFAAVPANAAYVTKEYVTNLVESVSNTLAKVMNGKQDALPWPTNAIPRDVVGVSGSARPLPPYLHAIDFADSYTNDAAWYYELPQDYGHCSSVRDGNSLSRNYDWKFDFAAEFVVRMSAGAGRLASVGVANVGTNLTEKSVTSGRWSRFYKCLPGHTVDGVNENGVACNVNVVDGEPEWDNPNGDIHPLGAVRWVLDNAASAGMAASNLANRVKFPSGWMQNFHWMIADKDSTWIVENGNAHKVDGRAVMTNFRIYPTRDTSGAGQERHDALTAGADITSQWWTLTYTEAGYRASDLPGIAQPELTQLFAYWKDNPRESHRGESFNGANWWQTVHTSIYDITNRTLRVSVQETDDWYVFAVPSAGGLRPEDAKELSGKRDKDDLKVYRKAKDIWAWTNWRNPLEPASFDAPADFLALANSPSFEPIYYKNGGWWGANQYWPNGNRKYAEDLHPSSPESATTVNFALVAYAEDGETELYRFGASAQRGTATDETLVCWGDDPRGNPHIRVATTDVIATPAEVVAATNELSKLVARKRDLADIKTYHEERDDFHGWTILGLKHTDDAEYGFIYDEEPDMWGLYRNDIMIGYNRVGGRDSVTLPAIYSVIVEGKEQYFSGDTWSATRAAIATKFVSDGELSRMTTNDVENIVTNEVEVFTEWTFSGDTRPTETYAPYYTEIYPDVYGWAIGGTWDTVVYRIGPGPDAEELLFYDFPEGGRTIYANRARVRRNALGLARLVDVPSTNGLASADDVVASTNGLPERMSADTLHSLTVKELAAYSAGTNDSIVGRLNYVTNRLDNTSVRLTVEDDTLSLKTGGRVVWSFGTNSVGRGGGVVYDQTFTNAVTNLMLATTLSDWYIVPEGRGYSIDSDTREEGNFYWVLKQGGEEVSSAMGSPDQLEVFFPMGDYDVTCTRKLVNVHGLATLDDVKGDVDNRSLGFNSSGKMEIKGYSQADELSVFAKDSSNSDGYRWVQMNDLQSIRSPWVWVPGSSTFTNTFVQLNRRISRVACDAGLSQNAMYYLRIDTGGNVTLMHSDISFPIVNFDLIPQNTTVLCYLYVGTIWNNRQIDGTFYVPVFYTWE